MEYGILGPLTVNSQETPVHINGPREQRGLALLLLEANRCVSNDRLVRGLWDERPPRTALAQVRNVLARLRKQVRETTGITIPIRRLGSGYRIDIDTEQLDVNRFTEHVRTGRQCEQVGDLTAALDAYDRALALWRGPALDGMGTSILDVEAHRLEDLRVACLERQMEVRLALGDHQKVADELPPLALAHPMRERLVELQMIALHGSARRQEALALFTDTCRRLREFAGLDPRPELVRIQRAILRDEPLPLEGVRR